jgi:hypothetical protein
VQRVAAEIGRPARQRTTDYATVASVAEPVAELVEAVEAPDPAEAPRP